MRPLSQTLRLIAFAAAAVLMIGGWAWRWWEERAAAEETCRTLVEAYRSTVAEKGAAGVNRVRFKLEARHASRQGQGEGCRELATLLAEVERSLSAAPAPENETQVGSGSR